MLGNSAFPERAWELVLSSFSFYFEVLCITVSSLLNGYWIWTRSLLIVFNIRIPLWISDYVSTLKIVDESYRANELSVQIFTGKVEDLPLPRSHKDFIILYKVKVLLEFHYSNSNLYLFGAFCVLGFHGSWWFGYILIFETSMPVLYIIQSPIDVFFFFNAY